jgi:uncharacterized protein
MRNIRKDKIKIKIEIEIKNVYFKVHFHLQFLIRNSMTFDMVSQLASELSLTKQSIAATIALLAEGNTVPFIARYRKEVTGNLDEVQIRDIQERHKYLSELEERKVAILASIEAQGLLTEILAKEIQSATTKTALEDLYLPYKPKRRTRATIAREKGLQPLADLILSQENVLSLEDAALSYIDKEKGVESVDEALAGARDIVAEIVSENAAVRARLRECFAEEGILVSKVLEKQKNSPTKFEQYYNFQERVATIPSHRFLAIRRGEKEDVLQVYIEVDADRMVREMFAFISVKNSSKLAPQLTLAIEDSFKRLIAPAIEADLRVELKMRSDRAAVDVFAANLSELLLAAPLGRYTVIGIDPGLRTGCKCAVVDDTGKFLDNFTVYPSQGENAKTAALADLLKYIKKYKPFAIAIGNGTAGRETLAFVRQLLKQESLELITVSVNESGASVYSASDVAREEFPDLDLTVRGAISIARRLQDPIAELVKVDPKAIGVGQYQHDVYQPLLQEKLDEVVESCVNKVGVELNTASAELLARVAGVGGSLAKKIVLHRDKNGAFRQRGDLLDVHGLGPKAFQQAAGFLRISKGATQPLDASAVHPERYGLVEKMAKDLGVPVSELIGNQTLIQQIDIKKYVSGDVGELTLADILSELAKPGRDPRASFEVVAFRDDINKITDLQVGMSLEGIVTNVTAFGAFVDIGVHQDGLIHLSELSDSFVKEASDVVKVGDKIKVVVLAVDSVQNRISLSAKKNRTAAVSGKPLGKKEEKSGKAPGKTPGKAFANNPFASL